MTNKLRMALAFHTGVPSFADGLGDYQRKLIQAGHSIGAKGADNAGPVYEVQQLARQYPNVPCYGVYRKTTFDFLNGWDTPQYGHNAKGHATEYWNEIEANWPPELDKSWVWVEFPNEVDKNESEWLGTMMYWCGVEAINRGYKYCGPGWSGGEPEPSHWYHYEEYLKLCEQHPDRLGISVHEYTFSKDIPLADTIDWQIGRVKYLNDACDNMGIARPVVFITEAGWGANDAPDESSAVPQLVEQAMWYIENTPNVKLWAQWCLDSGWQWESISRTVNGYIQPLGDAVVNIAWPQPSEPDPPDPPIEPPIDPDPPTGENMIKNGGFELGWYDHEIYPDRIQVPNLGWSVTPKPVGSPQSAVNQKTGEPSIITGIVEANHKGKGQLPPHEWPEGDNPLFFGEWGYKVQAVHMVSETWLSQAISGLTTDRDYKFSAMLKVHYHPSADSIGEVDDVEVWVKCGGNVTKYLVPQLPDRSVAWIPIECVGTPGADGILPVHLVFFTKWANSRDFFVDECVVVAVGAVEPPIEPPVDPEKPKIVIYKLAQEHSKDAWEYLAAEAHDEYKRTLTASHDDMLTMMAAGNDQSYAIVFDSWYASQQHSIEVLEEAGYMFELREYGAPPPPVIADLLAYRPCETDGVTQYFGANPENYEPHGLPGHEGIDYGVPLGRPFFAAQDGEVVWASNLTGSGAPSNYGYHVYLKHIVGGQVFHTVYAHAEPDLPVTVGEQVLAGQVVAFSGNTGNSTGPHLHFGLLVPFDTGNGYPMWRFGQCVDPYPYLEGKEPPPYNDEMHDLLPYIKGDGRLYEVKNEWGSQERFQTQWDDHGMFYQTKNQNGESFFIQSGYIMRDWDTSPGGGRFYRLSDTPDGVGSRWVPQRMAVDQSWTQSRKVQFYDWNCTTSAPNSGNVTDTMKFVAHFNEMTFKTGFVCKDVIQLEWVNGGEYYFYAKGYGLVGWERKHHDPNTPQWSAISEEFNPGERPNNEMNLPVCLSDSRFFG